MRRTIILLFCCLLYVMPWQPATAQGINIGTYTFKDGGVYTGELKGRKPNGKGRTVMKNGDVYDEKKTGICTPDKRRIDGEEPPTVQE